ncbi:FxsA family protein [Gilliamella sp. B2776]|uniref:FxsA family protein n=1 Tax=unclassified Gilliamella TaxID=2685620 RepID=UPI00226ABEC3|nr:MULTISPECIES: FxsA family protein [unclassified Gilliamella]MCX8650146.1 FxsA family protein [Gilliamella sp. B2779]MCX8653507.1 FxsA family protein [Gilliamella sp. B2737]MCX8656362.1 FxsA family protein [Gilliamella sp. B2894]MCX8665205.1 FxsA family protein [Gilliamella sp. B2887]MCX8691983.1 FxsA family protein [Gilliamella sp. B2776]
MRVFGFIIFFIYAYFELSFFINVADSIGVFLALIGIIATSIIGFSLIKKQGLNNLSIMQQKIANHQSPKDEIIKSVSLLFAGFLLLIPGFLTDMLGAILLIPRIQDYIVRFIVKKFPFKVRSFSSSSNVQLNDVIEGEFERKDD